MRERTCSHRLSSDLHKHTHTCPRLKKINKGGNPPSWGGINTFMLYAWVLASFRCDKCGHAGIHCMLILVECGRVGLFMALISTVSTLTYIPTCRSLSVSPFSPQHSFVFLMMVVQIGVGRTLSGLGFLIAKGGEHIFIVCRPFVLL